MLQNINFNRLHPFDKVLSHQYEIGFSEDKKTVTLKLLGFKSYSRLNWPTRYQSYRIALIVAQLPDFEWKEDENCFQPVIRNMERLTVSTFSEWHPCSTDLEDILLTASFARPALQIAGTTVVVALGIEVSSYSVSASPINPSGFGTMKIVECFV